jgi:hypothetical protein
VDVNRAWREVGLQSFALHPQFAEAGTAGYGKLYVWVDTDNTDPQPIAQTAGDVAHHTVLLDIVRSKREEQGRDSADRVDLRIAEANGEIYLLNKYDGVLRRLVP